MWTDSKLARYVSLVWEVQLKDVVRVSFDAVEEVVVCGVEPQYTRVTVQHNSRSRYGLIWF